MSASELLAQTLSPDAATRQNAETQLESASRENYPAYMLMLSAEVANEATNIDIRRVAGVAMKNALNAKEIARQQEYSNRWLALDQNTKAQIKNQALATLSSPTQRAGGLAAMVVAAIAAIELPQLQWNDLIDVLMGFINNQEQVNLRISTLSTIGFICEQIKPEVLSTQSNQILTAVIQGARKEEPSPAVQLVALRALLNSLEFVRDNFEREGERNYIMQVVCEATQSADIEVQAAAFECLVRIMGLYYEKMSFYMERALFGLTVMGMKSSEERVALQAIEFWSTVCEEEAELLVEAQEAAEYGEMPESESRHFAKIALPEIVPVLLTLLTQQDEDADEDEWNVSMAAGTCLSLLASAVQDAIVPAVIPFIEANIRNADWHNREAAVMTFGSILDGPDPSVLAPLVNQALPLLIDMMTDTNVHVKDTTAWTLGRVSDLLIQCIKPDVHLHPLVSALVNGLSDSPRIIANSCWALMNLADQLGSYGEEENAQNPPATSPLSPYCQGVVEALLRVTETSSNESNYRTSAYEAITSFVTNAPQDAISVVQNTSVTILSRMEHLLGVQNQIVGTDDRNNWNDLQSNFCSVIISAIRKLGPGIQPLAERIMTDVLHLIQAAGKTSTILEDAFLVVGTLASALEQGFSPYVSAFLPYLHPALKAHEDSQLCTVAVGLIGDITRSLGDQSAQYAGAFMSVLIENLQSEVLNRNVKISVLTCFGDIALAIGPAFEPYLEMASTVLAQAGRVQPNPLDYDLIEYVAQLREGILEAYTGIVTGLKNTEKSSILLPHVQPMLDLIQRALSDDERSDAVVRLSFGIIGDLADTFPNGQLKNLLSAEWIAVELRSKARASAETKKTARWARELVKRAIA